MVQRTAPAVGTVVQQTTTPTDFQNRNHYQLGWVKHGLTTLVSAHNTPTGLADQGFSDHRAHVERGLNRLTQWTGFGENTGLTLSQDAPTVWSGPYVNYHSGDDDPNTVLVAAPLAPIPFDVIFSNGVTHLVAETVMPFLYEDGFESAGAPPPDAAVIHRIIGFPDGTRLLQLSSFFYSSFLEAVNAIKKESRDNPTWDGVRQGGVVMAWAVVRNGAADWGDLEGQIFNVPPLSEPDAIPQLSTNPTGAFKWGTSGNVANGTFTVPQEVDPLLVELLEMRAEVTVAPTTNPVTIDIEREGVSIFNVVPQISVSSFSVTSVSFNLEGLDRNNTLKVIIGGSDPGFEDLRVSLRVIQQASGNS
jgi:hypothetical protein